MYYKTQMFQLNKCCYTVRIPPQLQLVLFCNKNHEMLENYVITKSI